MTEVERFFRQIVRNLTATDPARLHRPLPLADIRDSIVPYRSNRRALDLESSEEYELILMRLCAGEGGFARTEPGEVGAEFAAELRGTNPDLALIRLHEKAVVSLEARLLKGALEPKPDLAFAPPDATIEAVQEIPTPAHPPAEAPGPVRCTQCKAQLPSGRIVNFCPHCGQSQALTTCPVCQTELDAGWRHCVSCGYRIGHG